MSFEDSKLEATPIREKDTTASAKEIPLCQSRMEFSHLDGVQFLNSVPPGLQQCSTGCLARGAEASRTSRNEPDWRYRKFSQSPSVFFFPIKITFHGPL